MTASWILAHDNDLSAQCAAGDQRPSRESSGQPEKRGRGGGAANTRAALTQATSEAQADGRLRLLILEVVEEVVERMQSGWATGMNALDRRLQDIQARLRGSNRGGQELGGEEESTTEEREACGTKDAESKQTRDRWASAAAGKNASQEFDEDGMGGPRQLRERMDN